jgi:hypothetical protein
LPKKPPFLGPKNLPLGPNRAHVWTQYYSVLKKYSTLTDIFVTSNIKQNVQHFQWMATFQKVKHTHENCPRIGPTAITNFVMSSESDRIILVTQNLHSLGE